MESQADIGTAADVVEIFRAIEELEQSARLSLEEVNRQTRLNRQSHNEMVRLKEAAVNAIRTGATTGDLALDFSIVSSGHMRKERTYESAKWLIEALKPYPGELVLQEHGYGGWNLGVVPDPAIPYLVPYDSGLPSTQTAEFHYRDIIALTTRQSGRANNYNYAVRDVPVFVEVSLVGFDKPENRAKLHIGNQVVEQWLSTQSVVDQFKAWMISRLLARPLDATEAVWAELQRCREEAIAKIIAQQQLLVGLYEKLRRWQAIPQEALNQRRGVIMPTETGVTIDFGLSSDIEKARTRLEELVTQALVELLMADSPTVRAAAQYINMALPDEPEA